MQDVAVYKIAGCVIGGHVLLLCIVFFVFQTDQKRVVIGAGEVPVVFGRLSPTGTGKGSRPVFAAQGNNKKSNKKTGRAMTRKSSKSLFKSSYPVSALKDRPAKTRSTVHKEPEAPWFSPKKQEKRQAKQPAQEIEQLIIEKQEPEISEELIMNNENDPVLVEGDALAGEVGFYEPVYSALIQHWSLPQGLTKGLVCTVRVTVEPEGTSSYEFIRKSGVLTFDTAVRAALLHARYPTTIKKYTKIVEFRS